MHSRVTRRNLCGLLSLPVIATALGTLQAFGGESDYPLSVTHALGNTFIPAKPERIVTVGWNGEDAIVALGYRPLAMPRRALFESGIFPWVEDKFVTPAPILLADDFDYEEIALLRPDLILGVFSGVDAKAYARFSQLAPTVVYKSGPWQADWREQISVTGQALGVTAHAESLMKETNSFLRTLATNYPSLNGRTFSFGTYLPGSQSIGIYLPSDTRIQLLKELGLEPAPGVRAIAAKTGSSRTASVSFENISSIDADILIMWYGDGARADLQSQPLFKTLGAVQRKAHVALEDPVDIWSTSAPSVLSIPYGFSRFIPRLAEAAATAEGR